MKFSQLVVVLLCIFIYGTVSADNQGNGLEGFNTAIYGKCINEITAANTVGTLKDGGKTPEQARERIVSRGVVGEFRDLHFKMIEIAYSDEHKDKSRNVFAYDMERKCRGIEGTTKAKDTKKVKKSDKKKRKKRVKRTHLTQEQCDKIVVAATSVARSKEKGGTHGEVADRVIAEGGSTYTRLKTQLQRAYWPEHVNKTAQEYIDYTTDVWCKLHRDERIRLVKEHKNQ